MDNNVTRRGTLPPFRGMMPIMATPITESGELDEVSQRRLIQYSLKCGAVAIGHLAFASEFFKISDSDRQRLITITVDEVNGRVPVFIGVAAPSDYIAVDYAKKAEALGADIIMAAAPYISTPDKDGMFDYYKKISDSISVPVIIQDMSSSAAILTPELISRLYEEVENIHYIKAEGGNFLQKMAAIMELTDGKMSVIGGAGGRHLIHMLRLGVTAFMSGTEALDLQGAAVKAYLEGDEEKANQIYFRQVIPYLLFYSGHGEELLKKMLHLRGIIDCPNIIPPPRLAPMSDVEWEEFRWVLERIGFNKRWPDIP